MLEARAYLDSSRRDEQERLRHMRNLRAAENRLLTDINERTTPYIASLEQRERTATAGDVLVAELLEALGARRIIRQQRWEEAPLRRAEYVSF
jgi:hypothetical protein